MSFEPRPVVNQRLYFCRLHLDLLKLQKDEASIGVVVLEQALGESILFHLVMAYRAYLRELAVSYNSTVLDFENATDLSLELDRQGHPCAEVGELTQLESGNKWLASLLIRFKQLAAVDTFALAPRKVEKQFIALTDITAVEEDEPLDTVISCNVAEDYLNQLTALIESQRERLEEW